MLYAAQALLALAAGVSALPTSSLQARTQNVPGNFCGSPDSYEIIYGTPWIVYSMNYDYEQIVGSICTGYTGLVTGTDGQQKISWNSTWEMEPSSNVDTVKGYSFVGLTENLETQLSAIDSIPSTYYWLRSNTTSYKGNVVYDFMTSPTKGDSTSSSAKEFMLWLRYEGGQLPIGYADGVVATIQLYGKSWSLYQGENTDTGIIVSSLLVDESDQYYGWFEGDVKEWLSAMVTQGVITDSDYVNVGNAGMEPWWGEVTFQSKLGLNIVLS